MDAPTEEDLTEQVADHEVRIIELEGRMNDMKGHVREAVADGVVSGFDQLFERKKKQAAESTGRWLWSLIKDTLLRWGLIFAIVVSVGKAAGWSLAAQVFDAIMGSKK